MDLEGEVRALDQLPWRRAATAGYLTDLAENGLRKEDGSVFGLKSTCKGCQPEEVLAVAW